MDNKKQPTEHHEPNEENLVQDLKKSLENTINETQYILDDLEETVETTTLVLTAVYSVCKRKKNS